MASGNAGEGGSDFHPSLLLFTNLGNIAWRSGGCLRDDITREINTSLVLGDAPEQYFVFLPQL